jgi:outer membrane protein OmpA-like peptidoglycan-associated protein
MFTRKTLTKFFVILVVVAAVPALLSAQDRLPRDNGLATYHADPRYRPSESHLLRVLAYVGHPIGWVAREAFFRPLSYFASSTSTTRSVMGYREPYDFREPECFSADSSVPDCRSLLPFNYDAEPMDDLMEDVSVTTEVERHVYFPNINFDFDVRTLNELGKGRTRQLAVLLNESDGVHVVLEGHADYKGSVAYNDKLGMDRADAVRKELVAQGVSPERLSTVTFGKSKPIYEDKTDWARAVNRRVEVHVDGGEEVMAEEG